MLFCVCFVCRPGEQGCGAAVEELCNVQDPHPSAADADVALDFEEERRQFEYLDTWMETSYGPKSFRVYLRQACYVRVGGAGIATEPCFTDNNEDHTADVILHSWGQTLEEAFAQCCASRRSIGIITVL